MTLRGLPDLLAELRSKDVKLALDGERLKCDAPKGVITPALARELAERKPELVAFLHASQRVASALPPIRPAPRGNQIPLSYAQEGAWFIDRLQPGVAFNITLSKRFCGRLDVLALEASLNDVVARHESLRTTFGTAEGKPQQIVHRSRPMTIAQIDLSAAPSERTSAELQRTLVRLGQQPFDLARGPLLRATLIHLAPHNYVVQCVFHHSISDGWSVGIFSRELAVFYAARTGGGEAQLDPLTIQYPDYAIWQRQILQGEFHKSQVAYWKRQLAGFPPGLPLVTDRLPSADRLFQGDVLSLGLSPELAAALRRLALREAATPFMLLLAAFQVLLLRYTGQDDIVVGTPIACRNQPELANVIGFCVNLLALRTDLAGNPPFRELLRRVRQVCLGAYDHQELPYGQLVQELAPDRSLGHSPLFQVQFALQEQNVSHFHMPGLTVRPLFDSAAEFDELNRLLANAAPATDYLSLFIVETGSELMATMHYRADLFHADTIHRLLAHFRKILEEIAVNPEIPILDIPLVGAAEKEHLCLVSRTGGAPREDVCLHQLVESQASRTPEALAVVFASSSDAIGEPAASKTLTYRELNCRANQLAHSLLSLGVGVESRVVVLLERTPDALVTLLGVLKAGGTFVPLDASYPRERLALLFDDSQPSVVVTLEKFAGDIPLPRERMVCLDSDGPQIGQESVDNPACRVTPENVAYVIYTSGSTGRPKGVVVPHRSVVNHNLAVAARFGLTPADRVLQFHSISFDAAIEEIFPTWLCGATLVMRAGDLILPGADLHRFIARHALSVLNLPTAYWHQWVDHCQRDKEAPGEPLRLVIVGGDQVSTERYEAWKALVGKRIRWLNTYGPTETTVISTCDEPSAERAADDAAEQITIGRPIDHTQAYVLDSRLELAPLGVPGELYVGGRGVARGYHQRPALTAERFVPDPLGEVPGARLYRTGDRARYRPDGRIEFLGRIDQQVKIRGFRVEPGEIAAALREHQSVREALVVGHGQAGDKQLVAYVARSGSAEVTPDDLRDFLSAKLPSYMVPAAFVVLDEFPLTPGGKIDRRALPDPANLRSQVGREYVAPRTPVELELARIWSEVLGVPRVGAHDNFFALGGHSLKASEIVYRLRQALGVDLPLRAVFESPTLEELAKAVIAASLGGPGLPPIEPAPRDGLIPLSYAQEGAWFVDQLQPGVPFNIPLPLYLRGQIDFECLKRALSRVIERHEALRTSFGSADGQPFQRIADSCPAPLAVFDLRAEPAERRWSVLVDSLLTAAAIPFDLARAPLFRVAAYRLTDDEQILLFTAHHIIFDGRSVAILARDLTAWYQAEQSGTTPELPRPAVQYADYAIWQRKILSGEYLETELAYWRGTLANYPTGLNLPLDRAAKAGELFRGDTVAAVFPEALSADLRALAQREGVTLFMLLLAAFKSLLARYTGQEDIIVGTPIANRNQAEMAETIGFCVNMLALRSDLSRNPTCRELLARVRTVCLGAYAHQELPFGLLVQHLRPDRHLAHSPFFSVGFALHQAPATPPAPAPEPNQSQPATELDVQAIVAELEKRRADVTPATDLLFLQTADSGTQIAAVMQHSSAAFSADTIRRMMHHYEELLAAIAANPDARLFEIPLLDAAERQRVLVEWNGAAATAPRRRALHELFEAQAASKPDAIAVIVPDVAGAGEVTLTYDQLNRRANQLARYLQSRGVQRETRVGIALERSAELLVAVWAVLKAGATYVPLDPAQGEERLRLMHADAELVLTITAEVLADAAHQIDAAHDSNLTLAVDDAQLAYVVFTSGSSGRPKGVMVAHRSLVNAYFAWETAYGLQSLARHLQMASFSFDVFAGDLARAHGSGAALVLCPREALLAPEELGGILDRYEIDCAEFVPAVVRPLIEHVNELVSDERALRHLRLAIVGSDSWYLREYDELARLLPGGARLVNSYGVAEATIDSTWFERGAEPFPHEALVPIGRPFAGTRTYVLDAYLNPAPVGAAGELYLGGPGLARGYMGRPQLTAERFVPDPFSDQPGARLYRTGDRARHLPDGTLELLGRVDHQIKIRGFRIEPGEVEAALTEHPQIQAAVVIAHRADDGENRLVAYVSRAADTPDTAEELTPAGLRSWLASKLPAYMTPAAMLILDEFPLTPNGKIDRRALPDPAGLRTDLSQDYVAPRTPTEIKLARIWGEVLSVERVGIRDNFFALGGHSLLAARLVARVRHDLEIDLPLRALFEHPTVEELAHAVDAGLIAALAGEASVDLAAEAVLAGDVTPGELAPPESGEPKGVLLTGATGFLGAYLLAELLEQTSADIYCLVRAPSAEQAHERLRSSLASFDLWDDNYAARIVPVIGDLAEPRLGISAEQFDQLAACLDLIYHNGAWVNFMYPYSMLKPANVLGTEEVLRLACRTRLKPVHYVSTLSVFAPQRWTDGAVDECFRVESPAGLQGGYAQSKWVAEQLVAAAADRGLPVSIHRPGRITGDSRTGVTSETLGIDHLNTLLQLGIVPRVDWPTSLHIVPVDYVARALVTLSRQADVYGRAFHLANPNPGTWDDVLASLRRAGYELREVDSRLWAVRIFEFVRQTPTHALHEMLPYVPPQVIDVLDQWRRETSDAPPLPASTEAIAAANGRPLGVDCRNTLAALADSGVVCPTVAELLDVYLAWMIRSAGLAPPIKNQSGSPVVSQS